MTFGTNNLAKNSTTGYFDGFIAQIDNNSNYQWSLSIGGPGNDTVGALLTTSDGSIISGGDFTGTVWFGDIPRSATELMYLFGNSNTTKTVMASLITMIIV